MPIETPMEYLAMLDTLNALPPEALARRLSGLYEHSDWVVERAAAERPFASTEALLSACAEAVRRASETERRQLIDAHPELAAGKLESLTPASQGEQRGAGLDQLDDATRERFLKANADYQARHGIPFIICVKGHSASSILAELERRLPQSTETEFQEALNQIDAIAAVRLPGLLDAS
ncbi:2-oxo-4-hydroxy-4-carboxy-5-ureidoimidazoline decarboxylase [Cobetia sp. 14N.309.X.WAT.E.A4]|uniref:2-oxo-4-hydroxy-4-carboxy-5-ureidoimidazoline decarboxylase n=1 Tax=Cobetia marina TaxID=28258 RepID=A0ABU9GJN1_COBMA|nr:MULTISPECIES: 2-oxo-4-hydroxy-4-carboxy-5-ureidoimidazoline decarboxylase [Cobetia]MDA5564451.1 2-oxo-4-hydroxy-4-carboxy-5-ureidoimidazoline decarboxylase [Cobetia sp. MMG027]MDH2291290.1 2-oxo-4-hydroxy-4-carboxy-5-ureidoimidazoline decarboxylase [Cobetia sp. 10Alg 146]MDH2374739.1 2-oxo-4-hydroxy-4-carboxy-5-ureidoimidazoline decarboxylase [Cobetia sp. 3AK]MDN2657081.1 2-oxo-4-hydroxy-4-carboxy-5-ureidoimidazoline decarboxylase [Cobetia sp. 14N.309.X.WAT.E.A4]